VEVISRKVGRFGGSAETHHIASRINASPSFVHTTCANSILACEKIGKLRCVWEEWVEGGELRYLYEGFKFHWVEHIVPVDWRLVPRENIKEDQPIATTSH